MKRIIFDIEADAFLSSVTKVHCVVCLDLDSGKLRTFGPTRILDALSYLATADILIAHNGLDYDMRVLKKLHSFDFKGRFYDTLVLSRLIYSDLGKDDEALVIKKVLPPKLWGAHSMEAWGYRLGVAKEGADIEDFSVWTQEMQDRCVSDVMVNKALWDHLKVSDYSQQAIDLQSKVAEITVQMTDQGWYFDVDKATELYAGLVDERERLEKDLKERFGSWQKSTGFFTPKRDDKKRGYTKGVPIERFETVSFNPGSRHHIAYVLQRQGWKPKEWTESGQPKLDEEVIGALPYPEAKLIHSYLLIQKRIGQIAEGDNAWLKLVDKGVIHPRYNVGGTVTGRCAHSTPNIAQVPKVQKNKDGTPKLGQAGGWGWECRELFTVPKGWSLVGADKQGLELRCFAHYLAKYDKGAYAQVVTEGDPHTFNQNAAGLETRDQAKTFILSLG